MARKVQVTAGGLTRSAAGFTAAIGVLFLIFGVVFMVVVMQDTPDSEDGLAMLQMGFLVIWVAACLGIVVYGLRVFATPKDPAAASFLQLEEEGSGGPAGGADGAAFDVRLRKLEALRKDGLLTEEEYRRKRADILGEKW